MAKWKVITVEGFDSLKNTSPQDNSDSVYRPSQEQVQSEVGEPQVATLDDQTPMESEDLEERNDGEQTEVARDILNDKDKFDAHIKEIDSALQFNSIERPELNSSHSLSPAGCLTGSLDPPFEVSDALQVGMGLEAGPQVLCTEDPIFTPSLRMDMDLYNYKRKYQEDGADCVITNPGKKARGVHDIKEFSKVLADSFKSVVAASQRHWAQ